MGVEIQRNQIGYSQNLKPFPPFAVVVTGEVPESVPEQFWQLVATVEKGYLKYLEGKLICENFEEQQQIDALNYEQQGSVKAKQPKNSETSTIVKSPKANGLVRGKYTPSEEEANRGTLTLRDGSSFKALIVKKLNQKLANNPQEIETLTAQEYWWRVNVRTEKTGEIQSLNPYSYATLSEMEKNPEFFIDDPELDMFEIRGKVKSEPETPQQLALSIAASGRGVKKAFSVVVTGEIPSVQKGQLWSCNGKIENGKLWLIEANLIQDSPPQTEAKAKKSKGQDSDSQNAEDESTAVVETIEIPGRAPEVVIKFNEKPELPSTGKKVPLTVEGENGIKVVANLNRKTLKKQVEKMDSFADWIAALSGKTLSLSSEGLIELDAAGLQVFEKKSKND